MKKKRRTITVIVMSILLAVIVIVITVSIMLPKIEYKNKKDRFNSFNPCDTLDKYNSVYALRFELSLEEWPEFQKQMTGYQLVSSTGGVEFYSGTWPSYAQALFTREEIANFTEVYFKEEYVGIPFLNRCRIESCIGVNFSDDMVRIYYSANLVENNIK